MTKEQELEKQLQDYRKAKEAILSKTDACLRLPEKERCRMWDSVAPHIKSVVESRINNGSADWNANLRQLQQIIFEKVLKSILGDDALSDLEKV